MPSKLAASQGTKRKRGSHDVYLSCSRIINQKSGAFHAFSGRDEVFQFNRTVIGG
jgi:hypothetical protein